MRCQISRRCHGVLLSNVGDDGLVCNACDEVEMEVREGKEKKEADQQKISYSAKLSVSAASLGSAWVAKVDNQLQLASYILS